MEFIMTISEVIKELEDYKQMYGDIRVEIDYTKEDDYSGEQYLQSGDPFFKIKNYGIRTLLIKIQ